MQNSSDRLPIRRGAFFFPDVTPVAGNLADRGSSPSPIRGVEILESRRLLTAVTSVWIHDADTDEAIRELKDGDIIDYDGDTFGGRRTTLVAKTDSTTASVKFGYDDDSSYAVESSKPFAIKGDTDGRLDAWPLSNGDHTVTVTPYSKSGASGTAGSKKTFDFEVKNADGGSSSSPSAASTSTNTGDKSVSGNDSPKVSLGSTALGTFAGPGYALLHASASDPDGDVKKVEWYANGDKIGETTAEPYMIAWKNIPNGTYKVTAKAYDNDGASKTSSEGTIKIISTSGDTIHVDKDGSDNGSGSSSNPYKTIKRAEQSADPGDTILVHPGTYKETIRLKESGTSDKPITIKAADGLGSVTIDLDGKEYAAVPDYAGAGKWTTLIGLVFKNAENDPGQDPAAVKTTDGWRIINCRIENVDGAGVGMFGKNVILVNVESKNNGATGIGGSRLTNSMILDSETHGNNTDGYSGSYEGGGGKFTKTNGLLIDNYKAYDNDGPGVWFDGGNTNIAIRNSEFHDNNNLYRSDGSEKIGGRGIFFETSGVIGDDDGSIKATGKMLVEDNLFYDNDHAGVDVYATMNTLIRDNTFVRDYINLKDKRPRPYIIKNLTIVDNKFKDGFIIADTATVNDYEDENFKIDRNTYDNDSDDYIFNWDGRKRYTPSAVNDSFGFEKNGKLGDVDVDV